MQPLDLVSAAPWEHVVFTTYALSLSFFEAVVLERLVRGGGRNALVLSDPEGIRAGLSEQGARRAGRDYELEPVACTTGVFHPKLSLFFAGDDAHLLIGSGNLTFGGWGINLETVDHLHPSFAADAFNDAADMFDMLSISDNIRTGVSDRFEPIGNRLRAAINGAPRNGDLRLLHSVGRSIAEQILDFSNDLGGATRVSIVSPFFDKNGGAVSRLLQILNCEDVRLHAHPTCVVRGAMGINWPEKLIATPVCIDDPFGSDPRQLHAKCIEVLCRRGRLLISGSANATSAALFGGNVEASLIRIQRETLVGWETKPATSPEIPPDDETDETEDSGKQVGILRAVLNNDHVSGEVIVPRLFGEARLSVITTTGLVDLGNISIDRVGKFEATARNLELHIWGSGRIVLRIEQHGRYAEGFVSIAAVAKIMEKAGAMASRLFAMLSGTETPEDVAAILTWFKEDTDRIVSTVPRGQSGTEEGERKPTWVPIRALQANERLPDHNGASGANGEPAWQRALWLVRSAFAEPRGPWKSGTAEDDGLEEEEGRENGKERLKRLEKEDAAKQRATRALDSLLDEMLAEKHNGKHADSAFALTHYLTDRIRPAPSQAKKWLSRIFKEFARKGVVMDAAVATAGILLCASDGQKRPDVRARAFLIRSNINPNIFEPDSSGIPGFVDTFQPEWDSGEFLRMVRATCTAGEEVRAYLEAAENNLTIPSLPILEASPYWPQLVKTFTDKKSRSEIQILKYRRKSCPKCNIVMPTASYQEMQLNGVTRHCGIILCEEV